MKLVILAAGMGSRYGGLKQLDPVGPNGEFIIDFSIYDALDAGFDEVVFIIKKENLELFRSAVSDRLEGKIKTSFAFQDVSMIPDGYSVPEGRKKPWGTAHALLCAREAVGDDLFAVINADDFYGRDAYRAIGKFLKGKDKDSTDFCMAGYVLKNTLTENGSVSRGVCVTDADSYLVSVAERTKIQREADGTVVFYEDDKPYAVDENSYVSMNFWGFTPRIFDLLEKGLRDFLDSLTEANRERAECYLPMVVSDALAGGKCRVKLIPVHAKWYGVTYIDDKPFVVKSVKGLVEKGEYPATGLWK